MKWFPGLEVRTVGTVTAARRVKIDAAAVRAYRTLYGEINFIVEGRTKDGAWQPISREYTDAAGALDECERLKKEIAAARGGMQAKSSPPEAGGWAR